MTDSPPPSGRPESAQTALFVLFRPLLYGAGAIALTLVGWLAGRVRPNRDAPTPVLTAVAIVLASSFIGTSVFAKEAYPPQSSARGKFSRYRCMWDWPRRTCITSAGWFPRPLRMWTGHAHEPGTRIWR